MGGGGYSFLLGKASQGRRCPEVVVEMLGGKKWSASVAFWRLSQTVGTEMRKQKVLLFRKRLWGQSSLFLGETHDRQGEEGKDKRRRSVFWRRKGGPSFCSLNTNEFLARKGPDGSKGSKHRGKLAESDAYQKEGLNESGGKRFLGEFLQTKRGTSVLHHCKRPVRRKGLIPKDRRTRCFWETTSGESKEQSSF